MGAHAKIAVAVCFSLILLCNSIPANAQVLNKKDIPLGKDSASTQKDKIASELKAKINKDNIASAQTRSGLESLIQVYIHLDNASSLIELPKYVKLERTENNIVQARVPISKLSELETLPAIIAIRSPDYAEPVDLVFSEGLFDTKGDIAHVLGTSGKNVKIAVIDAGFIVNDPKISANVVESYSFTGDITGGYPAGNSHGTAVAEIIHDMAPDAQLYLYNIYSSLDFNAAVDRAISKGVNIISISMVFNTVGGSGPYYRDGTSTVAKKLDDAYSAGIISVVAAGNYAQQHWSGSFSSNPSYTLSGHPLQTFQPTQAGAQQVCLPMTVSSGQMSVMLTWDNWPQTNQDYDFFIYDSSLSFSISSSQNSQYGFQQPLEVIDNLGPGNYCAVVKNFSATGNATLHILMYGSGSGYITSSIASGSISTPADSLSAITVGAVDYYYLQLEPFSSLGPTQDGRNKPEICGPDAVSTSSFGYGPSLFFGTSAATPHIAGVLALEKEKHPTFNIQQLKQQLTTSALALDGFGSNKCGAGLGRVGIDTSKLVHIRSAQYVFSLRPDLQSAFPEAATSGNLRNLLLWSANYGISEYPSTLGFYAHHYKLMNVYYSRPDLQAAYPEAANSVDLSNLLQWAGQFGTVEHPTILGRYGHIYDLMRIYYSRPDLQAAYPEAANGAYLGNLLAWADAFGVNEQAAVLAAYAPIYDLMRVYYSRPDLQSAFPEAANGDNISNLLVWASHYGVNENSPLLGRYGHIYDLMRIYYSRPDLQSAFPEAANGDNLKNLLQWAGQFGTVEHPTILGRYGHIYDLMRIYYSRPDLQSAFPEAGNAHNIRNLLVWASRYGINEHPSVLGAYSYIYKLLEVYYSRPDLQAAYPEAANGDNNKNLSCWARTYGVNEDSRLAVYSGLYSC